jgi:hypothetical protein
MLGKITDAFLKYLTRPWVTDESMTHHGIKRLMEWAQCYNGWRYAGRIRRHLEAYATQHDELLRENGAPDDFKPRIVMKDGWALDTSQSLPHLDALLEQAGEMIKERGGKKHSDVQQPFLRNLMFPGDMEKYPALLDFITSSEVLGTVMEYLGTVPVFSKTRPPGVRFMESNAALDPGARGPHRASQLYHLDIHDNPLVYVLVLIDDVTMESGPWTFLPSSVSQRASQALNYQHQGVPYRVTDQVMYQVVKPEEAITFAYPKGSVLFIDSSRCFHYGSRNAIKPRFQLMFAYTSARRGDFSQTFMPSFQAPIKKKDSTLRRMVLE